MFKKKVQQEEMLKETQAIENFWNSIDSDLFKNYLTKENKLIVVPVTKNDQLRKKIVYTLEPENKTNKSWWKTVLGKIKKERFYSTVHISYQKEGVNYTKFSVFPKSENYIKIIIPIEWQLNSEIYTHIRIIYNCNCAIYFDNNELEFRDCKKCRDKVLKKVFKITQTALTDKMCIVNGQNTNTKIPIKQMHEKYMEINFNDNTFNFY